MATPKDVLDIARSELGITEQPPESNHQKFGQWYGFDGVPWCAEFVSYCFYNAGIPLPATTSKGFAAAERGRAWFESKGWFQAKPAEGDVIFYHFQGEHAGANHVGIVEEVGSTAVTTIEGNTSAGSDSNGGQVQRRSRAFGSYILGYGRPQYDGEASTHALRPQNPKWPGRSILLTSPLTTGADVREWQAQMKDRGWHLDVDGEYGNESEEICRQFQKEKGLPVDGVIGPKTWAAAWDAPVT
ncbi:MAG TPA: peptidoglycan-binding protein [Actinomycetota bacterium]